MRVEPKLSKGERITCPECRAIIGEALDTIPYGRTLTAEMFHMKQVGHANGQSMCCVDCGTPFAKSVVHTEYGWK